MYEAYFGLAELPFGIAPDPHFYVDTAPHRAAIRALMHRLRRGDAFVMLVGDTGAGKTAIARQLLDEMDPAFHLAVELSLECSEGDQLFDRVAEAFGTPRRGGLPPLGSVIHQLESLVRSGRDALLLIDDAQELDAGALRRLLKLTAVRVDGKPALRVCLVGLAMPPALESMQLGGRRMAFDEPVRLEPLDAAGTHEYVLTRLGRAGWRGWPAFGAATVAIHERCAGNPMRINRLSAHILLQLYKQARDHVTPEVVRAVDDLLQAELRGEAATLVLPPVAGPEGLRTFRQTPFALDTDIRVSSDALMSRLLAQSPLPLELPEAESAQAAADRAEPSREPEAAKPRRAVLTNGLATLAIFVSVCSLWPMLSNLSAHAEAPAAEARPGAAEMTPHAVATVAAAGLATLAEQAVAETPPAAGPPAHRASSPYAFRPASGPRSSRQAR